MHRVSAFRWLRAIDEQLRHAMGAGLEHFAVDPNPAKRPRWNEWLVLSVALDCGSDGVAGVNAALRQLSLNMDFTPDQSHLAWRGVIDALKASKLWVFMLTAMLAGNVAHGPWCDDLRYRQSVEAMDALMANESPECCPLFMASVGDMAVDLRDKLEVTDDATSARNIWDFLRSEAPWRRKGAKSNVNRFLSAILQGHREAHLFALRSFMYSYCVLELDMVGSAKFRRTCIKEPNQGSGDGPTSRTDVAEKSLRAACQNQMVVAALFYSDRQNRLMLRMVVRLTQPIMRWFEAQSRELRSAQDSALWMFRQQQGEFGEVSADTFRVLSSEVDLHWVGFLLPKHLGRQSDLDEFEVMQQDDVAQAMGRLSLNLVGARSTRNLWLTHGWPSLALGFVSPEPLRGQRIAEFRQAHEGFERAKALQDEVPGLRAVIRRSPFELVHVQQLWCMLSESAFSMTREVTALRVGFVYVVPYS